MLIEENLENTEKHKEGENNFKPTTQDNTVNRVKYFS